jgi:hypothetical protein
MSLLVLALCIRTVSRQAVRDNGSARDKGVKAAVLCSTDPGDEWIEKIRLDRRRGSFSASAEPYQSNPEGKSAESPERTEIDWRLDIIDPTSGCDGPVDNRRHALDGPARIERGMTNRSGQEPPTRHRPRANPKTTHVMMLIHVLRDPLMPPGPMQSAARARHTSPTWASRLK